MLRSAEKFFPCITALLAVTCAWGAIAALLYQTAYQYLSAASAFLASTFFCIVTASFWLKWRARRTLALLSGVTLGLYTLSTITLGREELRTTVDVLGVLLTAIASVLGWILGLAKHATTPPNISAAERTRGE